MKIKVLSIFTALVIAVLCFSACGKTETAPEAGETAAVTETADVTEATAEDGQNPIMNFIGNYQSDRRTMLVEADGMDGAKVSIHWGSDAWTSSEWVITGKFEETDDSFVLNYTDGSYATVTYDDDGNATRSDEANDCSGTLEFNKADGTVIWTDSKDETINNLVFEFINVNE